MGLPEGANNGSMAPVRILLFGQFSVVSDDGRDRTPRSAKAQGLIALLATSAKKSRARAWLQDKLWSDRGQEQGAASLRQALSEIRKALGPWRDALGADRSRVWLADGMVDVVLAPPAGAAEFLEGIDVRDPEFESWLREERMARAPDTTRARPIPSGALALNRQGLDQRPNRPSIYIRGALVGTGAQGLLRQQFVDCITRTIGETLSVDVRTYPPLPGQRGAFRIDIETIEAGAGQIVLRASLHELSSARLVWNGLRQTGDGRSFPLGDLEVIRLANELIEALADELMLRSPFNPREDVNAIHRLAVRKLFTLRADKMDQAEALFKLAHEMEPRGIYLAWLAQLQAFRAIERHGPDRRTLSEGACEYTARALELEPLNSMVLAVVSYARNAFDPDPLDSAEIASRSVEINPYNPIALDSLSIARLYTGDVQGAHDLAVRVQRLGMRAPNRFWWDMGLCVSAAANGQTDLAIRMAHSSAALAPSFRAPLRYLVALYAGAGDEERAIEIAAKLKAIEPEFTFDRLALDAAYPVGVLRKTGLLRSDRIRALGK